MNAGELKKALEVVPDNTPIVVQHSEGAPKSDLEAVCRFYNAEVKLRGSGVYTPIPENQR